MTTAAFQATYSDVRLVKGRKVVQFIFEVPLEASSIALEVLGGMPDPASEVWCAIARLVQPKESAQKPRPAAPHKTGGAHSKNWHEMSPAQQAGLLCAKLSFQNFMREFSASEKWPGDAKTAEEVTAGHVRRYCGVTSRSQIAEHNKVWKEIVSDYRAWMREPQVVG